MAFNRKQTVEDFLLSKDMVYINDVRQILCTNIPGTLRKAEMAHELADYILTKSENWLRVFPCWELSIVADLVEHKKGFELSCVMPPIPMLMQVCGVVDCVEADTATTIYRITDQMHDAVKKGIKKAIDAQKAMNYVLYEKFTRGVLNLYGMVPKPLMAELVRHAANYIEKKEYDKKRNTDAFLSENASLKFFSFYQDDYTYVMHPTIDDPMKFYDAQHSECPEQGFKLFDAQEFYDAGGYVADDYPGINDGASEQILRFMEKNGVEQNRAYFMMFSMWRKAQEPSSDIVSLMMYVFRTFFNNEEEKASFQKIVEEFNNNIPMWIYLGRTRKEFER